MKKEAILITGASSGIGFEFAHVFCEKTKLPIILVARRLERLEKLKEVLLKKYGEREIFCISRDLRSQSERSSLVKEVHQNGHFVQTLVNNAGYGSYGYFKDSKLDWELDMIRLNCEAVIELSHSFLPDMLEHNSGAIINVSSMASFQGLPFLCTYAATKAFVTSFSLGLAAEIKGSNIKIQALCPGPVATEFINVAGFPDKISVLPSLSARQVAELSVRKLIKGQRVVIPGWMNFILSQLNRLLPRAVASDIARMVLSNKFKL